MQNTNLLDLVVFLNKNPGKEKISLSPIEKNKHLTLHFGTKSRIIDIHIKNEIENDPLKKYETVLKISYFSLMRLLVITKVELKEIIRKSFSKTINKGKLGKGNCILQPISSTGLSKIVLKNKKGTKVQFKKDICYDDLISIFVDINDLDINTEIHFVYKFRKGNLISNGTIFKRFDKDTCNSFIYLSEKEKKQLRKKILTLFLNNLHKIEFIYNSFHFAR